MYSDLIGLCGDINDSLDICRKLEVLYRVIYLRVPRCLSGGTCNIDEALQRYEFYKTIHAVAPPPDPRGKYENKKKLYIIGNLEPEECWKVEGRDGKLVKMPEAYMGFIAVILDQFDTEY